MDFPATGRNLKAIREKNGLTQEQQGRVIGLVKHEKQTIRQMEIGKAITLAHILKYATYYRCKVEDLVVEKETSLGS